MNKKGNPQTSPLTVTTVHVLIELEAVMAEQAVEEQAVATEQPQEKRDKSTIQFAYLDLDDAVAIASGVHAAGGTSCQMDQLAAQLNVKADTGSFRLRLGTARIFGFITFSGGTVTLTNLGVRVCDPQQEAVARGEAFLNVPLYRQIYEQFKGGILPNQQGLESAMANLGVAPKQKTVARQVFARSAQQAGFFQYGNNRLVPPRGVAVGVPASADPAAPPIPTEGQGDKAPVKGGGDDGGSGDSPLHPLIRGLIKSLPPEGQDWPIEKRAKWLRAAAQNFDLIYPDTGMDSIEIRVQKGSTT
ncbi:MAG TPA: hypothetical protein VKX45_10390 [Bryobacteraceae bacterium]|nr:hypothetical protein [Bryobacteraceae bacterium]